jgi:hypothetical protein
MVTSQQQPREVKIRIVIFWDVALFVWQTVINISEEHTAFMFISID